MTELLENPSGAQPAVGHIDNNRVAGACQTRQPIQPHTPEGDSVMQLNNEVLDQIQDEGSLLNTLGKQTRKSQGPYVISAHIGGKWYPLSETKTYKAAIDMLREMKRRHVLDLFITELSILQLRRPELWMTPGRR
jgi:hypothetical protein